MSSEDNTKRDKDGTVDGSRRRFLGGLSATAALVAAPALVHPLRPAWAEDVASLNSVFIWGSRPGIRAPNR